MPPDSHVPAQVFLVGDQFARQGRDSAGLAVRLYTALQGYREIPAPVHDFTVKGGLTEIIRGCPKVGPDSAVVCILGAHDAKGGGPPPASFVAGVSLLMTMIASQGGEPIIVLAPPCPADVGKLKGYAKGSRRWLRRIQEPVRDQCRVQGVSLLLPELPDHVWGDQLSLRPEGVQALVEQIVAVVAHEPRSARIRWGAA